MTTKFRGNWSELREFCVRNGFYTRGTNEEYSELFRIFGLVDVAENFEEMAKTLERVAKDILDHSDEENCILCSDYEDNKKEVMSCILETAIDIWFD